MTINTGVRVWIDVPTDKSDALKRVKDLNEELQYIRDEYGDLNVQVEKFDTSLFTDDIVYVKEDTRLRADQSGKIDGVVCLESIIVPAGAQIYRDYALKHNVPIAEEKPNA